MSTHVFIVVLNNSGAFVNVSTLCMSSLSTAVTWSTTYIIKDRAENDNVMLGARTFLTAKDIEKLLTPSY